ncbi:TraB/GumN family protein [Halalkaliarchaeum sp. AArc-GB]|uniref:TraB/GumN family protein n=1 Tax=Halalkaliarchaeum sp. AArc-GB TaxID=3074078 RepID=UPI0028675CF8|nr:TraB/GumN family protein [Halalkaliarchaeum sp. AArc-GB]MDR5672610.1 TraB/GumN family protein [Halalkaliarchaeum sp. AArc-GB]
MSDTADREGSVTVVGTAHISSASVEEVEETIDRERPDVVAVELDEGRYRQLQGETPEDLDASDLLRGNTVFQFLAYWMLSYVQTKMGERFDVTPGADMMAAVETAEGLNLDVALVDREIQTTIQRFWARMSLTEKLRMIGGLAFGVGDSRAAGLVLGLAIGIVAGPIIALFGGSFGVTDALLVRVTGAALVGIAAAYLVDRLGRGSLSPDGRLFAAIGGGGLLGIGLLLTGVVDPYVEAYLGGFVVNAVGSLTLGITTGILVGGVVALFLGLFEDDRPEEGGLEELSMEELTDTDVVSMMMEEFRQFSPGGAEALIDERDAYIAHKLVALREAGYHVVAVVGAGHQAGIERYLREPEALPPMEELTGTERGRGIPWFKVIGVVFSIGFVAFFLLLAMAGVRDGFLLRLFAAWFLINAVFAFSLAKLAGARWTSAGVGGAVAWLTSINPMLAPGWFAGYAELRHLRVNVGDITRLNEILSDETRPVSEIVSEMFDVPLFRLIMVVAMTNVGSMIATFLFATYVLPMFFAELGGVEAVGREMVRGAQNSADLIWRTIT